MNIKIKRIITSKYWKVERITSKILISLDKAVDNLDNITQPNIKQLSNLFSNENIDTAINYFKKYNKKNPNEKRIRSLENFILYHGNKKGRQLWNEFNKKIKKSVTKEGFVKRYGINNGEKKYKEYKKLLSIRGIERVKKEGRVKQRERSHFCKEFWIKKGFTEKESIENVSKVQSINSIKHHSKRKHNKTYYKKINPICIEYWIDKDYSINGAKEQRYSILKKCDITLTGFTNRYGELEGKKKYNKMLKKRKKTMSELIKDGKVGLYNGKASKESLLYFIPLKQVLINDYNIDNDDIYFGEENNKEFYLANGKSYYFLYDFTIRSKKIIIEYNGIRWHPNPNYMNEDEWNKWRLFGMTAEDKLKRDNKKLEVAKQRGFDCLVIWSCDSYESNMTKILKFMEKHLK